MKNLTKAQKLLIVLSILWEIILLTSISTMRDDNYIFESAVAHFVILSLPVWLYWAGVWIWDFGYLKNFGKKFIPLKEDIKKRFSFKGTLQRGEFLGLYIFFAAIPNMVYVLFKNEELVLFSSLLCLYGFVNIIIKRANSFTNTPWFYGVTYILFFILIIIKDGLKANGINLDNAYQYSGWVTTTFYAWSVIGLVWIVMFLYLCFKKSEAVENKPVAQEKTKI